MAKLTEPQKAFIVSRLACFYTPSEVAEAVKQEFGIDVPRQQVGNYNPLGVEGRKLSKDLKKLFEETRDRFRTEIQDIPIANQAYRLRKLQDLIDHNSRNASLVASLMEQAAKETGGSFTNKREVTGKDGASLNPVTIYIPNNGRQDGTQGHPATAGTAGEVPLHAS